MVLLLLLMMIVVAVVVVVVDVGVPGFRFRTLSGQPNRDSREVTKISSIENSEDVIF